MSLLNSASLVVTPNGYKAGTLYSVIPNTTLGDMDVVRATTATRVNSAGLIESVANDVPRLDYSNGSCPSLLLEPQRTNLATYSEQANQYSIAGATIGSNVLTSPNGVMSADSLIESGSTSAHAFFNVTLTTFTVAAHTASVFAKKGSRDFFALQIYDGVSGGTFFNLNTGTIATVAAGVTATITDYGNGWYRCTITATTTANVGGIVIYSANADNSINYTGTNGLTAVYFYGWQLEAGSYPTSYIPTTTAAVTRNADQVSKTGISSLIGQTEGVFFLDLFASAKNNDANTFGTWIIAGDATNNFQIYNLGTTLHWFARDTGGEIIHQTANETLVAGTRYKIAYAYKSGDYALYINGVQKRTSASANVPSAVSQFNLSSGGFGASPVIVKNEYNSAVLFPTRLTNAELASLTTI